VSIGSVSNAIEDERAVVPRTGANARSGLDVFDGGPPNRGNATPPFSNPSPRAGRRGSDPTRPMDLRATNGELRWRAREASGGSSTATHRRLPVSNRSVLRTSRRYRPLKGDLTYIRQ